MSNWLVLILALALGLGLWFATTAVIERSAAARIPALPDVSAEPRPVIEQLTQLDQAARNDPTSADAIGNLAMGLHASTLSRAALPVYELAASLDPQAPRWVWGQILLYEEFGETDRAFDLLSRFPQRDDGLFWFKLAETQRSRGDFAHAREAYKAMAAFGDSYAVGSPRPPVYKLDAYRLHGLALVSFQAERYEEVIQILGSLPVNQSFGPAHRLRGRAYQQLGRAEEAAKELEVAERLPPYTPPTDPMLDELALRSRSTTFILRSASQARTAGDLAWAERLLRQALELYPDDHDVVGEFTLLLCAQEQFERALPYLDHYLALAPEHPATAIRIGTQFSGHGRHEPAIRCFQHAVKVRPDNAVAWLNLGAALAADKQFAEAERCFRQAVELDRHSYLAHFNLARVLLESGQPDQAADHARQTLKLKPDFEPARRMLLTLDAAGREEVTR